MYKWFLLTAIFPLTANAQGGRALLPWWDNPLTREVNLTGAQRDQIRAVVKEYRNRLVDERAAVEKADGELEDVFAEDSVDQRRAAEAIDRLTAARAELTRSLAQMSLRMRTVLTAQQWQDLQRRQGRGGPRGEGALGAGKNLRRRGPGPGPGQGAAPPAPGPPPGVTPPPPPPVKQF